MERTTSQISYRKKERKYRTFLENLKRTIAGGWKMIYFFRLVPSDPSDPSDLVILVTGPTQRNRR